MKKPLLVLLAACALPVVLTGQTPAALNAPAAPQPTLAAGAVAPDFVTLDIAGKEVRLADFKGKILVLDFWATWCGPCIASFPHTQEVAAKYKDQGVVVLAAGTSDTKEKFLQWIPANQGKYPDIRFTYDPKERGEDRASSKLYRVRGIPTQFIIGRDGVISAVVVGNSPGDARAEAALAQLGVKVDAAIVAKGERQLRESAEAEKQRAAELARLAANPPPPFMTDLGRLKGAAALPDFLLATADGKPAKLSDFRRGKPMIIGLWSAGNGPGDAFLARWNGLAKAYADQVDFLGIGGYDSLEALQGWMAKNKELSFRVAHDGLGKLTPPAKSREQMSPEELKAETARSRAFYDRTISMQIGGVLTPVPTTIAMAADGTLIGWSAGFGPNYGETIGNLLLRAGVKLAAADMPKKVTTDAELKAFNDERAARSSAPRVKMLEPGAVAPDFTTTDLSGKPVKLSDYRGKVVVLDFWATWCGPCIASMPHSQEVAAKYKDQGVVILASCTSDTRDKFESWVKANQAKYPDFVFSHDPAERGADRASAKLYGVGGIPQQFIIGRDGKIAATVTGYLAGEVLLDAALAKAGIKVAPEILAKAEIDQKKRDAMR
jgi:thiol-disulfide isomerase/thioredoxin